MRVGVIGSGLAGMMTAAELHRRGEEVIVLEASDRIGGVVETIADDGFIFESAGGGFVLPHPALDHFIAEFGLDVTPAIGDRKRYLALKDRLVPLPSSPPAMLASTIVSASGKLRALREPTVDSSHGEGETILEFMTRRFGDEVGPLGAHLAAAGVFAGDPDELSVEAAFPRLVELERRSGSVLRGLIQARRERGAEEAPSKMYVPSAGMSGLVERLASGLTIRTGSRVESVEPSGDVWKLNGPSTTEVDEVVFAVDSESAGRMLPDPVAPLLGRRSTAPVAVIALGSRAGGVLIPDGFGALGHPDAGLVSLGVLFESSYAPGRAPTNGFLVKVIAGGARRPDVVSWSDDYLVRVVGSELCSMLRRPVDVDWARVVRRRIPQYRPGHLRWLSKVDAAVDSMPGLHLTGWGYRGVGISHVASDALAVANRITHG